MDLFLQFLRFICMAVEIVLDFHSIVLSVYLNLNPVYLFISIFQSATLLIVGAKPPYLTTYVH